MSDTISGTIKQIGDTLRGDLLSFAELSVPEQDIFITALTPQPRLGFTDQQREWLADWWLECNAETLHDLAALQMGTWQTRQAQDGTHYLPATLLTDAVSGRRLAKAYGILSELNLVDTDEIIWPIPPESPD